MKFQLSYFKSWKTMLWKCLLFSVCQHLGNAAVATGLERSVFIPIPKKGNPKECSNYHTIAFILHTSKVMLKILQARLQQYVNSELSDVQTGFRKGRGTRDQIANIPLDHRKSKRIPEKTSISAVWLCQSLWLCGSQKKIVEISERDGTTRLPDLPPEKSVCRSGINS